MKRFIGLALTLIVLMASSSSAQAHKSSDAYLTIQMDGNQSRGQWDVALRDLDYVLGLDANNDGRVSWGELRERHDAISSYLLGRLRIRSGDRLCSARVTGHMVDRFSDGAYESLRFALECEAPGKTLEITYDAFFDSDPQHRGLLRLEADGRTATAVFGPSQKTWRKDVNETHWLRAFTDYFVEGVWHIWTGFDHVLFLASLLLPAVVLYQAGQWTGVVNFRTAFGNVVKVVTAFTLAHSITLSLAVLGYISMPSRLVESVIALSVAAAALNNIWPVVQRRLWLVAFGFGLVHGLGFASVLTELGLPSDVLAVALAGFNLGVESGQLAIVLVILPLAYASRQSRLYPRFVLGAGSLLIAAIAFVWLIERSLNVSLIT